MRKPSIAIKLSIRNYQGLIDLANTIIAAMTGNLNYTTPAPALVALQTAVTDVETALAAWGTKGNRGSHGTLVDLRDKALTLANMLRAEAQYVQNTAYAASGNDYSQMATIITSSGFQLSNERNPQGVLQKVQDLHESVSRQLAKNQVKLLWKKPLNVSIRNNVKSYRVLRNTSTDMTTATEVSITTRRSFIDTNTTTGEVEWTYWVIAYNGDGPGVPSDPITVSVRGA